MMYTVEVERNSAHSGPDSSQGEGRAGVLLGKDAILFCVVEKVLCVFRETAKSFLAFRPLRQDKLVNGKGISGAAVVCTGAEAVIRMEGALADGGVERFFACLDRTLAMGPQASVTRPVAVRFSLAGAGSFLLRASPHAPGSVTKEEPSSRSEDAVTCTLSCSLTVLLDLAGGRIKPAAAYLRGLISVGGDRAVFMQLRSVLQAAVVELKQEGIGNPGAVSVAVLGATVHAGPDDRYAVYQLEVSEGADSWLLLRRWSELRALERAMAKQRPPGLAAAPRLPRWLDLAGSLEAPFLAQRCGLLVRVSVRVRVRVN